MYRLFLAFLVPAILASCGREHRSNGDTSNGETMDTAVTSGNINRIQGPAGFIYVDDGGKGGLPVVFAHSFLGNTRHWEKQLEHLRENRRAIALDFRSHGQSDSAAGDSYSAESLAADIAAVVDRLGVKEFVLVGHSMGGSAAVAYAAANPDRVPGLVLAGTPGKTPADQAKPIIASLESDAYPVVMDQYMKQLLQGATPEVNTMVMGDMKNISKETSVSIIRSLFNYDPIPAIKNYKGKVLIISSGREKSQPNALANQLKDLPGKTIEGTSHWTQMDKPEEFNRILDEFLKSLEK